MLLAALLVVALGWWLHRRGELFAVLGQGAAGLAVGGIVAFFLVTERWLPALMVGGAWAVWRYRDHTAASRRARRVLGVPDDAGPDAVNAAWRRAMQSAHPDAGGRLAEAQALTAARDLLLRRNRRR